ncbi:MAG: hypothetical protein C5B44_01680 [Acidobacteria bacterium]|nr:MAG: hypothetical protein C5B44_01680 [Acidobacteriota bacterium]
MQNKPQARQSGLIVRELDNEILIYDTGNDKAHCLNETAALVWKECDGTKSVAEISRRLSRKLDTKVEERVVWFALKQFDRDRLLEQQLTVPAAFMNGGLNRREMVRVMGLAAVIAVPVVTSIVAPTAVQAATCLTSGQPCTTSAQCCSGLCSNGFCA